MKSKTIQRILFLGCTILLVFAGASVKAQTVEKLPLPQILEEFETRFEVRFSYEVTSLKNFKLASPNNLASLEAGLSYLKANTPFDYEQLDDRYITIRAPYEKFLCGTVLDLETIQPISNAAIYRNDELIGTTNEAGLFVINNEYQTTYTIRHLGYESTPLMNSVTNHCTTYYLSSSYSLLDEVVLNSIFTRGINKRPSGFYRIQTDNFGLLPGQVDNDVLQIAQALPGVESVDETISNLNIRGGTHDENLIVWNDIRMYQSGHFFGLISAFNPDLTKRVDIYKNGTHPRYGESVSGVIAMESKNTRVEKFQGAAGFNLLNGSAYAEFPISAKLGVQVSGRSSATSNIKTPTYKTYSQRIFQDSEITNQDSNMNNPEIDVEEEFNFYDLSTRILYDANENSSFQLHFLGMDNRLSFTEHINETDETERSGLDQRSMAGGLT
ncbi:MAG: TonB-dependent receptor plug domain-containing protein, partial [Flavobacteriaceae bacterium]|nr:TonB-dependent receptor plug domain-containing protein [Flavobacteriaceae bacterium]